MTTGAALAAFGIAALLLTITPGLDTALVLRTAVADSRGAAVAAGLGVCVGCLGWAAAVALGVGALLAASELAYTALRIVGAGYLLWLGIGLLLRPRRRVEARTPAAAAGGARAAFGRGLLTNLLNPKVGVFYVSFLPQFVPQGVDAVAFMLLLGAIHAALGVAWFSLLVAATRAIGAAMLRPRVVATLDRVTGIAFVAFGARLALDDSR